MNLRVLWPTAVMASLLASGVTAADPPPTSQPDATVIKTYPRLASGVLRLARLTSLPEGVLLRADGLTLTAGDLAAEIAKAPARVQEQLRKNAFFLLEQMTARRLLPAQAKAIVSKQGADPSKMSDRELMQALAGKLSTDVKVTDQEIADFYKENRDTCGGATLEQMGPQIAGFIRQRKQRESLARFAETLGDRTAIEVSAPWVKEQAALATDNPVDKARASGKPSLVDFGSKGCVPCDMLAPILETLRAKYDGKANVLFVSVVQEQILAARYGIESIPVQVFFDKDGNEVVRHVGFYPQDQIEKKLAELGVK